MDNGSPPPSYQETRAKSEEHHPPPHGPEDDGPPAKAHKHDANSYPGKLPATTSATASAQPAQSAQPTTSSTSSMGQYNTIDFLGNVSGGPHAAAAEALATFSSSVGDTVNNNHIYVSVPSSSHVDANAAATGVQNAAHVPPTPTPPQQAAGAAVTAGPAAGAGTAAPPPSAAPQHGPPFLCPTCNTSYSRLEYLRRHERRHADIRPFSCPCGKSFSRSDVLARHKTKCRVVLSGEVQTSSPSDARPKAERAQRGNGSRSTRNRSTAATSTRGQAGPGAGVAAPRPDRHPMGDLSVDPALSGATAATGVATSAVDPSMQPPPPLETGAPDHHVDESYSYANAPASFATHTQHMDSEYGPNRGANVHYAQAPPPPLPAPSSAAAHASGMPVRMHESKMYAPHGAASGPPRATNSAPPPPPSYVTGAPAIHPELSSRGSGLYNTSHAPTGAGGPGTSTAGPNVSNAFYAPQHNGAEHAGSAGSVNVNGSGANAGAYGAVPSTHYAEGNTTGAPAAGSQAGAPGNVYPHNKELARFSVASSGPLSPFSNTALSSNISPYLSAFSCARDMPRMSSPRLGGGASTASGMNGVPPATTTNAPATSHSPHQTDDAPPPPPPDANSS